MWEETIMLFPTQRILLSSGTGGKSLSSMARAGLASPALHTNALNDLALSPVEKLPKCRSQCDFFFIDTTLLTSLVKSLFCSLLSHSSLPWHLPAPGSQAAGDSRTRELWLAQHQNSHPSCPKSGTLPVMHQDSDPSGKHRQDGHPANIHPARSLLLEEIQLLPTLFWTHHCHQSLAVKQPSACTVRCLHSILKKYIPHLLQRYAPDTSILWAGSGLGPWMGLSSHVSSIQNKCHETLPFF